MPALPVSRLSDSILVGHLQTPLAGTTVLSPAMSARSALAALRGGNYDQAPVVDDDEPIGFVLARDLEHGQGTVKARMRPVLPDALASETASLESALPWLRALGFLFLLSGREISGFIVPSDLNKQAGRSYFFLALTALELRLAEHVRQMARSGVVLDALPTAAATKVRAELRKKTDSNIEADVVAELNLSHLFHIVGSDEDVLSRVGMSTREEWVTYWKPINELRIRIADSVRPVLRSQDEIAALLDVDRNIHALLAALNSDTW